MNTLKQLSLSLKIEKKKPKPPTSRLHRPWIPPADLLSPRSSENRLPSGRVHTTTPWPTWAGPLRQPHTFWNPAGNHRAGVPPVSTNSTGQWTWLSGPGDEEDCEHVDHPSMYPSLDECPSLTSTCHLPLSLAPPALMVIERSDVLWYPKWLGCWRCWSKKTKTKTRFCAYSLKLYNT